MVDLPGQLAEEPLQTVGVPGVERGGAPRVQLVRRPPQTFGVARHEHQLAAGRTHLACGLQADARAASHHHDRLPGQSRARSAGSSLGRAHGVSPPSRPFTTSTNSSVVRTAWAYRGALTSNVAVISSQLKAAMASRTRVTW